MLNSTIISNIRIYLCVLLLVKRAVSERLSCLPQMLMSVQRMSTCVKMGSAWMPPVPFAVNVRWGSLLPLTAGPAKVSCCCWALFSEFGLAALKQRTSNRASAWKQRKHHMFHIQEISSMWIMLEGCFHLLYEVFLAFIQKSQSRGLPQQFGIFFLNSFLSLLDSVRKILCYLSSLVQLLFLIVFSYLLSLLFNMSV